MQIRVKGRKVQFLRSAYVKEKKRNYQKLVASVPVSQRVVTDDLRRSLTAEEVLEAEAWFERKRAQDAQARREWAVEAAARNLGILAEAIETLEVTSSQAKEIYEGMDKVAKALKKAGMPKRKILGQKVRESNVQNRRE